MSTESNGGVDFLLIGATKAGTESIYSYFRNHNNSVLVRNKQDHYFCRGLFGPNYGGLEKEIASLEEYVRLAPKGRGKPVGDFDCVTLHGPVAAELIKEANPAAKIMAILRNPVDRAYSHYWMDVRECLESRSFGEAVKEDLCKLRAKSQEYCSLVRLGYYSREIGRFIENFGRQQVRMWLYDDLCVDQNRVLKEMCEFIGVDYYSPEGDTNIRENSAAVPRSRMTAALLRARQGPLRRPRQLYLKLPWALRREIKNRLLVRRIKVPPMDPATRELLREIYREDIFALQKIIGRDLTHWLRDREIPLQLPMELQREQKAKQAEYFDSAQDPEFEIERPKDCGRLYQWSIQSKFRKAQRMVSFPLYGATLLDICCGSGMGAEQYAAMGAQVTGLDISERSLERARERARRHDFQASFVVGDAEHLPFPDRSFDVVAVHDGLHHLPNPLLAVSEMARVARRAIIVIEPARSWLTRQAVAANFALDFEDAGNFVYRFREDEIYRLATEAGYAQRRHKQYLLYYRHEPFRWARWIERTPLFYLAPLIFCAISIVTPRLGNKLCVVCER